MSSLFEQLPPNVYQSLNRWYLISAGALCLTLLMLSYIHITTALRIATTTKEHPDFVVSAPLAPEREAQLIASEGNLKKLIAHHELFFKLFGKILSSVPRTIQLTRFSIEPQQIVCKGLATSMDDITLFMRTLQKNVQLNITGLDIQEQSPSLRLFTLTARTEPL